MFYDPLNPFGFQHTLSFRGNVVEITSAPLFKEEQIRFKPLSDHYFGRYLRFTSLIIKLIIFPPFYNINLTTSIFMKIINFPEEKLGYLFLSGQSLQRYHCKFDMTFYKLRMT